MSGVPSVLDDVLDPAIVELEQRLKRAYDDIELAGRVARDGPSDRVRFRVRFMLEALRAVIDGELDELSRLPPEGYEAYRDTMLRLIQEDDR